MGIGLLYSGNEEVSGADHFDLDKGNGDLCSLCPR